jgi:glycosyltransferase involved in cell wall biosynthesis
MITLVHIDGLSGINYHRLIVPLRRLANQGVNIHWIESLNELKDINLDVVTSLIVSRKASVNNHKKFSQMLKGHGVKLILDNDDYWDLNNGNPAKGLYEVYYGPDIKKTIRIADVIWTPSEYLGKLMKDINPKAIIELVNNALDPDDPQWIDQEKYQSKIVRFGYVGALGHDQDVESIGYDFSGKELYCAQVSDYPSVLKARYIMSPRTIYSYANMYKNFDVSLVPLYANRFNWSKSDLKITEAGFTKTAVIASNTRPYNNSIIHNETGILVRTREEWKDAIESMDVKTAKRLGENLHEFVKNSPNHNIDLLNEKRLKHLL